MDTADDTLNGKIPNLRNCCKSQVGGNDVDISNLLIDVIDKLNVGFKAMQRG